MKITINGQLSEEALKSKLNTQKEKMNIIDGFCKQEKIESLSFKDQELEYTYSKEVKKTKPVQKKVEVRKDDKGN